MLLQTRIFNLLLVFLGLAIERVLAVAYQTTTTTNQQQQYAAPPQSRFSDYQFDDLFQNKKIRYPNPSPRSHYKNLISIFEARNLEFGFPSEHERLMALKTGKYNPDSPIPIDVDVYYPSNLLQEANVFITIPRFGQGVPYSLAMITNKQRPNGTEIQAYPSYLWHNTHGKDCDGLTSVYRVHIDCCGHMWILDSGEIGFKQHCHPQLVVIDLATDQLIHRYRLPTAMFKSGVSRFVTPLVDIADPAPNGSCMKAMVYMSDVTGAGIVVYDSVKGISWRIENKYTYPDPDFGTYTIAGESFELMDGVFGLVLTPKAMGHPRNLYFYALSSDKLISLPVDVANNKTMWNSGLASALKHYRLMGERNVQCGIPVMTSGGYLLCGFMKPIGIVGWDIRTPYTQQNRLLLAENPTTLQFVSGMKIILNPHGKEEVWMLSNRLQKAFSGTTNFEEINYRVQKCGVEELLLGKQCKL